MSDYKRYTIVFFITLALFLTGFYLSNYFSGKKISSLKTIQDQIALNILSSETQFQLLSETSCDSTPSAVLSEELSSLSDKLDYGERTIGASNPDIVSLRSYFSLLEIKDLLLMRKLDDQCHTHTPYVLYFYSNESDCPDCARQWRALSALRDEAPEVRVYVFDDHSDLSAVKTLAKLYSVDALPSVIVKGKTYSGYTELPRLRTLLGLSAPKTPASSAAPAAQ